MTAVYMPSDEDISNGSVELTLTAYGPNMDVEDAMTLSIFGAPVAFAGDDAAVCSDATYEIMDATADNYISVLIGNLRRWVMFSDEYIINPIYTPGATDIETGSAILSFTVSGVVACGDVADDLMLTFEMSATADAGGDMETCSGEAVLLSNAIAEDTHLCCGQHRVTEPSMMTQL
ncbi:MAG: hypothetical protein R2764_21170 [Bacteroidales bacterium]